MQSTQSEGGAASHQAVALVIISVLAFFACAPSTDIEVPATEVADPLPSWSEGGTKQRIVDFVAAVTEEGGADFVPESHRIATFDNDGTLWSEQPLYFQLFFALDRIRELAPQHPEWAEKQPFKGAIEGDMQAVMAAGTHGILELVTATHSGMTNAEFETIVTDWLAVARHPELNRPYNELVYQPMLELLQYLRDHGFRTYITSGGGIEFMRPWVEEVYGIPPEQVIGSSIKVEFQERDGEPVLMRLPELDFIDDKEGKPVAIHKFIGRRPIAAFGNSDGDFQMLQWATAGSGRRLGVLIHHTDDGREWAYDRDSHIGRLARGLDEAEARGWLLVDMKEDWNAIYPAP